MRLLALALFASTAFAGGDFPPPETVFRHALQSDGSTLTIYWSLPPGYYLYKAKMKVTSATPGVQIGEPRYPPAETYDDEYFGKQEIFREDFTVTAPLERTDGQARELTVRLKLQGCADAGFCYPPQVWEAKVSLPDTTS